jgi:hypothetical protein
VSDLREAALEITIRRTEPDDYGALHRIFSGPRAVAGTLQMPFPSAQAWRERLFDNAAAIALYEKFGFEIEGSHRRLAYRDGEYVDSYSMARVRG